MKKTASGRRILLALAAAACVMTAAVPASAVSGGSQLGDLVVGAPVRTDGSDQCTASTRSPGPVRALGLLQSDLAWSVTKGTGVLVAVVDSGVNASNPHLAGVVVGAEDLVGDGAGPGADLVGHGTAIAGEIAAQLIPGSGVVGLAPAAKILSIRVFAGTSDDIVKKGFGPDIGRLAAGIRLAADRGAKVINVSMSTKSDDPRLRDAVAYAAERGALVVASAGNRDSDLAVEKDDVDGPRYPAGDPGAIGVAATDTTGVVTSASIHGPHVAVAAPGQAILTSSREGGDCVYASDKPATSFATAYVSAAAALVAAAHPDETPAEWAYRLEATAIRADPHARDDVSGWGIIQPYDAMMLIPGADTAGPPSPFFPDTNPSPSPTPTAFAVADLPAPNAAAVGVGAIIAVLVAGGLAITATLGVIRRRDVIRSAPKTYGRGLYGPQRKDDNNADA